MARYERVAEGLDVDTANPYHGFLLPRGGCEPRHDNFTTRLVRRPTVWASGESHDTFRSAVVAAGHHLIHADDRHGAPAGVIVRRLPRFSLFRPLLY
jgi:hypothetical protein